MCGIIIITPINHAWTDHFQRALSKVMFLHRPRLHRAGLGPHQQLIGNIKSFLHIPRRMVLGDVHHFKVVMILFHFRTG